MPEDLRPLLTIAIPTFNRAAYLQELLEVLLPQLEGHPEVELLVCNNAATDHTADVLRALLPQEERFRVITNESNIGSDANFVLAFRQARGKYFWLCGDDDILRPGTIACVTGHMKSAEYDMVYIEPEGFFHSWQDEHSPDPEGRTHTVVSSARSMALIMGTMIAFISDTIINRDRVLQVFEAQPEEFIGSALVHLSWTFPLLATHRKSLCLWQRWVAGRNMNSSFDVAEIFGRRYGYLARRLLRRKPRLARIFINGSLRKWFPNTLLEMRAYQAKNDNYGLRDTKPTLTKLFRGNPRYWFFMYPVLSLPLPLAKRWREMTVPLNRVIDLLLWPGKVAEKLKRRAVRRSRRGTYDTD